MASEYYVIYLLNDHAFLAMTRKPLFYIEKGTYSVPYNLHQWLKSKYQMVSPQALFGISGITSP